MEKSWLRGKCAQVRDCCFIKGGVGGLPAKVTLIRPSRRERVMWVSRRRGFREERAADAKPPRCESAWRISEYS